MTLLTPHFTPHFQLNIAINNIVGNFPNLSDDLSALRTIGKSQTGLIIDEFEELLGGFANSDMTEIRDGIGDVIVTVDGLFHRLGLEYPNTNTLSKVARLRPSIASSLFNADGALLEMMKLMKNEEVLPVRVFRTMLAAMAGGVLLSMYELSEKLRVDYRKDQYEIYLSNLSKFDTDVEMAKKGVLKYQELGVQTSLHQAVVNDVSYFVIKSDSDQIDVKGKKYPYGKFLKSVNFKEPALTAPLLEGEQLPFDSEEFVQAIEFSTLRLEEK